MLCGSSLWKSLKPWVSQQFCWDSRSSDATAIPDANEAPGERSIPLLPRLAGQVIITLAYTGSSAADAELPRRPRTTRATVERARPPKPAAVLATRSVCKAGRKQAWPSPQPAATPTHLHNRARFQLQRCAASARAPSRPAPQTAPPRGQPRKEHRARRRRIHLQLT